MSKIIKAVIFGGKARVAVLNTADIVNEAIKIHNLSPLSAAALGRTLTVGCYISSNLKGQRDKFNIIIDGGGIIGKIVVAGESGGSVRGFVDNPCTDLPYKNGKLDVGGAVGKDGSITVIKDLGLKEPYVGRCKLVTGEIAEDYANYLLVSEGITAAVALGVLTDANGCKAAGGVIIEAMPDATDDQIFMLEDIISNFTLISNLLAIHSAQEIMDYYFGHLDAEIFSPQSLTLQCKCKEKIEGVVKSLGIEEAKNIIAESGKIEVRCDFCNTAYVFYADDVDNLFID